MQIRVYYEDTDSGNVVYYANYLKYMERDRTEFLRERGVDLGVWQNQGILFAVVEVQVKYRKSARYNDLIRIETELIKCTRAALIFRHHIFNAGKELLVEGTATLVCIKAATLKACRIPDELLECIGKGV
ncbi:MAG: YbgC/FadM family acyl-CoA thioesterase [Desulfobacteraceae bacterium]|nr:MAG: YbgC/FadM family acyl-CoA thioesterase [Desulfobacteraceae bacterium]